MRALRTLLSTAALCVLGCAVNPATGERQLSLIGTQREVEMGREGNRQVREEIGLVEAPGLQRYVDSLGKAIAKTTERPDLPWSFDVVDDPAVNAFALPGGFIHVTRGILAYFESEAELAGVLGHEIGHVTARHSVNQMSRQQIEQIGLGVGMVLSEGVRRYGDVLSAGVGLLNLKYSRGDETQADELGVRYMTRAGYDPDALVGVFRMLASVSGAEGGRVPEWQSTHPYPENRDAHIQEVMRKEGVTHGGDVRRDRYLDHIDGITYGDDPREGYFKDRRFLHPDLGFQLTFPSGWKTANQKSAVGAVSPAQDALVVLQPAPDSLGEDPAAALRRFLGRDGFQGGRVTESDDYGIPVARAPFTAQTSDGDAIQGLAEFLVYRDGLYQILGYAGRASWAKYQGAVSSALESFTPVTDRAVLDVQPRRVRVVTLSSAMTVSEFHDRYPTPIPVEEVARLNRVDPGATFPAGSRVKQIVGAPLP